MTKDESRKFSEALAFASKKHAGQRRKDDTPYILHPIRVAMNLAEEGHDVRYQIAGLFHDILEDTDTAPEEMMDFCDEGMLNAVMLVTKKPGYDAKEYIESILKDPMAKAIKNADRIDNLRDLRNQQDEDFIKRYLTDTKEHYVGHFSLELDYLFACFDEEHVL